MDPEADARRMFAAGFDMIASDPQLASVYLTRGLDLLKQAIHRKSFGLCLILILCTIPPV